VSKEYKCALCEETFENTWSDEEAMTEFAEVFPDDQDEKSVTVCDDCYKKIGL